MNQAVFLSVARTVFRRVLVWQGIRSVNSNGSYNTELIKVQPIT